MNKALIGSIAGLLVLGGTAVGGSLYADQQLTDKAYSPELMQRSFGLANFQAQTNLGILSGSAQWQGDLVFDPCQPGDKVTIRGNDTIHRSLSGYRIDSKIYIVSDSKQFNTYSPKASSSMSAATSAGAATYKPASIFPAAPFRKTATPSPGKTSTAKSA